MQLRQDGQYLRPHTGHTTHQCRRRSLLRTVENVVVVATGNTVVFRSLGQSIDILKHRLQCTLLLLEFGGIRLPTIRAFPNFFINSQINTSTVWKFQRFYWAENAFVEDSAYVVAHARILHDGT